MPTMQETPKVETKFEAPETSISLEKTIDGHNAAILSRQAEVFKNVMFIDWSSIALSPPVAIQRSVTDHPRGRPYTFDQETLDTLAELPQPPAESE